MKASTRMHLNNAGISFIPVQDNESKSSKGVIRGLHYQLMPFAQAKLIRVVEGKIFDVALDLRKNSLTFGKWFGIELDSETKDHGSDPKRICPWIFSSERNCSYSVQMR